MAHALSVSPILKMGVSSKFRQKKVIPSGGSINSPQILMLSGPGEMAEFIRTNLRTTYHPVGTCKMGHDDLAVVDEQLRVYGVDACC